MVKLVYTYALGAYAIRCAGSSPVSGTTLLSALSNDGVFYFLKNLGLAMLKLIAFFWKVLMAR